MARIGIYGNAPWCPSGYGTQAAYLAKTLIAAGHQVACMPFHGLTGAPLTWDGIMVYPGSGEDPFALDLLPAHYKHFGADLLITLMDAWVLDPAKMREMNVAHWMPVDCTPLGTLDRRILDAGGGRPVAISRFGQKQLLDAGYDAMYVPHALPMDIWKPLEDRDEARRQLGLDGKFVVGINAANQDPQRKGFGEQFEAFAAFAARHDDALMLVHTRAETRQGCDLSPLIANLGMEQKILLGDQYAIAAGFVGEPQMVTWHCVIDLLSNCSWGEGFGLAVLQSQACGIPVAVTDCSSMTELCGSGWKVAGQRFRNRGHGSWWMVPPVDRITAVYEDAYRCWKHDPDTWAAMRVKAREFALPYDCDTVMAQHWKPALDDLLPAAREAEPVLPPGAPQPGLDVGFAERQAAAWSSPPVDDVGYISSAELLQRSDQDLLDLAARMRVSRYQGPRNHGGLWRDLMGLDELAGLDVMDFGCGTGVESAELAEDNQVVLADIAPANLELASRICALQSCQEIAGTVLVTAGPPYVDWPDGSLDVFYASGSLHHVPWARQIMERAHALLRPGGQARLMLYSDHGWRIACGTEPPDDVTADPGFQAFVRWGDAVGEYADWYDRARIEARFGDLFSVERCEYMTPDQRYLGAVLRRRD